MIKVPPIEHIPPNMRTLDSALKLAAERFGTPLYVYSLSQLTDNWLQLRGLLPSYVTIFYSVKANPNLSIIERFNQLGAAFEVASRGELEFVLAAGVDSAKVLFAGPGKSREELQLAVRASLGIVVAESRREVEMLKAEGRKMGTRPSVALRLSPGRGHGIVAMGDATQFGMSPAAALSVLRSASYLRHLDLVGLHGYLGTGLLDWRLVLEHSRLLLETAERLERESGQPIRFVDVGGGFGIPYFPGETSPDWSELKEPLSELFDDYRGRHQHCERMAMEAGRFLMGSAGVFVARVLYVKKSAGRRFAVLDGGTNVFGLADRYVGNRLVPIRLVGGGEDGRGEAVILCGPLCTSADRLAVESRIGRVEEGSLVAFYQAGAYGLTASRGLFLGHGFPREILFDGTRMCLVRERLGPEQLLVGQLGTKHWLDV